MPRNGSGTATRVTPPGASGYIAGNDILPSEVNGEINDIYNELTNSIDKAGRTTPTANLPMGGFKLSGLGAGANAGETVRFNHLQKGSDIAITASGSQTIPNEGSYFVLTSAGSFNITGFANTYNGRYFILEFPDNMTLVNSASLLLNGTFDRVTQAGDIGIYIQKSSGVYKELEYRYFNGNHTIYLSTANQALTINTNTTITFTADYNPNNLTVSSNAVTIKTPGKYAITGQFRTTGVGAVTALIMTVLVNGVGKRNSYIPMGGAPQPVISALSTDLVLAAGDTVSFQAIITGASGTISGANTDTYATIKKVD